MSDRVTKAAKVLKKLQKEKDVYNSELNRISFRYGSIIHELRKEGHVIKTVRINNDGLYLYKYIGQYEDEKITKNLNLINANPAKSNRNLADKIKSWLQ